MPSQLELFGGIEPEPEIDFSAERDLAAKMPEHVYLGTSSWTFTGWGDIVYPGRPSEDELRKRGLELYARYPLFRTVGIDRSYYRPLDERALRQYAAQLPKGFRCVMKVWSDITTAHDPRTAAPNPRFLNARAFEEEVLAPLSRAFAEHTGPLVFEFPPATGEALSATAFAQRLGQFFATLSKSFQYAVEIRNRELMTLSYLDTLARHGVAHVLNYWEQMPELGVQLDLPGVLGAPFVVSRLLIPPGRRYETRKAELSPFDRLTDPQEKMRADILRLVEICGALHKVLFVTVNNKVEGCSPLTVRALAERIVASKTL